MAPLQRNDTPDMIAVFVRHKHGIDVGDQQTSQRQSLGKLARTQAAIDQHARWGRTFARQRLHQRCVATAAAAQAGEAQHGAPRYFRSSTSKLAMRWPTAPFSGPPWAFWIETLVRSPSALTAMR